MANNGEHTLGGLFHMHNNAIQNYCPTMISDNVFSYFKLIYFVTLDDLIFLCLNFLPVKWGFWKRPWCWERLKAEEEDDWGWDGWMASPIQWTWTWANSGRRWGTGKPGMLQSTGSWRVEYYLVTEQQQQSEDCTTLCWRLEETQWPNQQTQKEDWWLPGGGEKGKREWLLMDMGFLCGIIECSKMRQWW